jgi:hypothetical protein
MHIGLLKRGCPVSREKSSRDKELAIHLHLVPRLMMNGAIPLFHLYAFKAWTGTLLLLMCFIKECLHCSINCINMVLLHITFIPIEHDTVGSLLRRGDGSRIFGCKSNRRKRVLFKFEVGSLVKHISQIIL